MKKKTATIFSLILCFLMILSLVCSCGQTTQTTAETSAAAGTAAQTAEVTTPSTVDEEGYLLSDLPALDYSADPDVNILYWSDVEMPEFTSEGVSGEIIDSAIFSRNTRVEEFLKVKLNWVPQAGRNSALSEYCSRVHNIIASGNHEADILAGYSQTIASATYAGNTLNLAKNAYIDFEKPWWPKSLTDEAKIGDNIYFVSGDISTNALYFMYCTFFNKQMLTDYNLENPYDLVENNQWTIDKMLTMATGIYADVNGSSAKDYGDRFGVIIPWLSIDAYFYSCGLRTVDHTAEGYLNVSESFVGERAQDLVEQLNKILFQGNDGLWKKEDTGTINDQFATGLVLFFTQRTKDAIKHFSQDPSLSYGIVPTPKYDSNQESYLTCEANPFTLYALIKDCEDEDKMGAVLECMASTAYRTTSPALYEVTLKARYAQDAITSRMYDVIRANIVFDVGRIFGTSLNQYTQNEFRNLVGNGGTNWTVTAKKFQPALQLYLDMMNDELGSAD